MVEEVQQAADREVESSQPEATQDESPVVINDRLLRESKEYKEIAAGYKKELEELKAKILDEQGTLQEKYEHEKSRNTDLAQKLTRVQNETVKKEIKFLLGQNAKDAIDVDDLFNHKITKELVEYDPDSLEVDVQSVKSAIEQLREKKPNYFSKPKAREQMNKAPSDSVGQKQVSDKDNFRANLKVLLNQS